MSTFLRKRELCPACGQSNCEEFYSIPYNHADIVHYLKDFYESQGYIDLKYLEGALYTLKACNGCKLIFQHEVPDDELLDVLYEKWIDPVQALERNRQQGLEFSLIRQKDILDVIAYFDVAPAKLHFLDFGMGWGNFCIQANSLGVNAFGTEISEHRIQNAKKYGVNVLSWEEIQDHQFDFINTDDVFEHLVDPIFVLNYLKKALKQGGIIKINVPNGTVSVNLLKKMDWKAKRGTADNVNIVSPLEHINCFFPGSIRKMAEMCGLEEVKVRDNQFMNRKVTAIGALKNIYRKYFLGIESTVIYFKHKN